MLADARKNHYAIPAFDVSNYEMIRCVAEVCEEEKSPAILMGLQPDLDGKGLGFITDIAKRAAMEYKVPFCLHLDHATEMENIKRAIDAGFSSVMYDGSKLPFAENAANTAEVVKLAHSCGVTVEAELGHVADAIAGNNQGLVAASTDAEIEENFTKPADVVEFVKRTNVDCLAVAVGTAHGVYVKAPKLKIDLLSRIEADSPIPLVLHGGSGTPDEEIRAAVAHGITKINVYSEVLNALNTGLLNKLTSIQNMSMWPCYVYEDAKNRMKETIRNKIRVFGSNGRV